MEVKALEAYAAVVATGSMTAAALKLGRSQPAVSRLVQELEHELGYALFERNGPRLIPTAQGLLLYGDVDRALTSIQQIKQRAHHIARGQVRSLRVCATSALGCGLVPAATEALADRVAGVELRTAWPEEVCHNVLQRAADVGFTSLPLDHEGLQVHWLGSAPCVLAVRADDPLSRFSRVSLAALAGRRLITMIASAHGLRPRIEAALTQAGVRGAPAVETTSSVGALAFVRAGAGVAVLEPVTPIGVPLDGVVVRPLDEDIPFYFGAVTPLAQKTDQQAIALIGTMEQVAHRLLPGFKTYSAAHHARLSQPS